MRTADLSDECGDRLQPCSLPWRSFARLPFHGAVATVRCHEDNGLVRQALGDPGAGRVLVVDGGGSLEAALVGDVLAALAVEHGWSGVLVHGAVRDVVALAGLPLGVLALGTNPRRGARAGVGEREVDLQFGGARFRPGDELFADEDGVLVGPRAPAELGRPARRARPRRLSPTTGRRG